MKQVLLAVIFMIVSQTAMAFSYTLELSEAEIQDKVSAMMPIQKKKFFVTIIMSNARVALISASNEIGLVSDIEVSAPGGVKGAGSAEITASLRYEPDKGEFFLDNLNIVDLQIDKVPEKLVPKAKSILQIIATKVLATKPVYQFKDDNLKHKLAKATLKSIVVENQMLLVELGVF